MKRNFVIACASGLAFPLATVLAQPATLVTFEWSTTGTTSAAANVSCSPPPCAPQNSCDSATPNFSGGGTSMDPTSGRFEGRSQCSAQCDCCIGGWGGVASATSDYSIRPPSTSESQTIWGYSDQLNAGAGAGGGGCCCDTGVASAATYADDLWDLTFDTTGTTRLYLARTHSVNVLDTGVATSRLTLVRVGGGGQTLLSENFTRTSGSDFVSGTPEFILPEGRYTLHVDQTVSSDASTATGAPGGGVQASFEFTVILAPYECAAITAQPSDAEACRGLQASFTVGATGTERTYQWRRNQSSLTDDQYIYGSNTATLYIMDARSIDDGSYDCVVTNGCGSVTSTAADLSVCIADYNCDSFMDGIDYDMFNNDFASTDPQQQMNADVNSDGFVDGIDYDEFNNQFETGC